MTELFNTQDYYCLIPDKRLRGNPNFKRQYSDKTVVIRVPSYLKDKIKHIALSLDSGFEYELLNHETSQDSVTQNKINDCVRTLSVSDIHCDPYRFQFKLIHNGKSGSTGSLKGVKVWNPDLAGLILVWLDPLDNKTYVINGHNRLDKAISLGVSSIAVRYISAPNAKVARLIGAMANIADNKGTAIDAAKIFRESKLSKDDLQSYGVQLKDSLANQGLAIAKLEEYLFDKTLIGELDAKIAVAIGQVDPSQQTDLYNLIKKDKRTLTQSVLDELVSIVKNSVTEMTLNLFGNNETESTAIEKAELISFIKRSLSKESTVLKTVSKSRNASILEKGNNKIDVSTSSSIAEQSSNVLTLFEQLKNQSGDVSYWLNFYADKLKKASNNEREQIKQDAYDRVWTILNVDSILDLIG